MDTKKLRQKILDLAIHGKLVPQDPNDEPASVLLERIRAEKEKLIKEGKIKAPRKSKSAGDTSHYPKDVPFELPKGWAMCKLGDVCQFESGFAFKSESFKKEGIPLIRISNIQNGIITTDGGVYIKDAIESRFHVFKGDLLIALSGATTGKMGIYEKDEDALLNQRVGNLRIISKTCFMPEYRNLFMESQTANILEQAWGGAQPNISPNTVIDFDILLPPYAEQRRIVCKANEMLALVSSIESTQEQIQMTAEEVKTKVLDLAIHGKFVPQDSSEEPAINLLRQINPDFYPSHNLHYEGELPSGWAVTQMKSIIELLSGRDLDNSRCNAEGYGVPYLVGASCIDKGRINIYRWTETPEVISKEGDVLLSCKGTVGEVVLNTMGNLHIARQFMAIRSKAPQYILSDYLAIIIKASIEHLKKAARGIIPGISREDILEMTVMIPPFEEQQRILSRFAELNQTVSLIVANTCN